MIEAKKNIGSSAIHRCNVCLISPFPQIAAFKCSYVCTTKSSICSTNYCQANHQLGSCRISMNMQGIFVNEILSDSTR